MSGGGGQNATHKLVTNRPVSQPCGAVRTHGSDVLI